MTELAGQAPLSGGAFPRSIAIAGAWGYIGRKFLDVALARGLTTFVYDPGPAPGDIDHTRLMRVESPDGFYALEADLFHLATHPEYRRLDLLLRRPEPLLILNEKPMAVPERPEDCGQIVRAVAESQATVLYDFPELFDPLTARILGYLSQFKDVRLTQLFVQRSKDREDPSNPRNYKRMVPIQFQESVHCLAFVLYVLGAVQGGFLNALAAGVRLNGESEAYSPPNPEAYSEQVDGRCRFEMRFGDIRIEGLTDFKRNAEWAKRRIIRGFANGTPFEVDVSYLEGKKHLRINGAEQPCDPTANSYEHVLATAICWSRETPRVELLNGLYPNPRLAQLTYQLSRALWTSCRERHEVAFASAADLLGWNSGAAVGH